MIAVLDVETKPFCRAFRFARAKWKRLALAPAPTLACIYWVEKRSYQFFTGRRLQRIASSLEKAECVVTYNGDRFDFLVLERWCGLRCTADFMAKSLDLSRIAGADRFRFLRQPWRKQVNLDRCGKLNFGMARQRIGTTREKCRAHVRLTFELFRSLHAGKLMVPVRPPRDLPTKCPACGAKAELVPFHPDYDQMTEGQIFDYELGQQVGAWGFARCTKSKCGKFFTWGI